MAKFIKNFQSIFYHGYKIEQVINHNPYLFYGGYGYPENHPKRRYMKPIYAVEWADKKQGYAYETYYYTSLVAAKRIIKKTVNSRKVPA
jgi:hypothetical protein